ncbi:MAG TPA: DUF6232 family protein [Planctomycetota bacterium]|nr:DUF6232 family protein [Planctomycetota bacterium]
MSSQVQISGDRFAINGKSHPIASLRQVEVGRAENLARSAFIFITCCLCPIAAMVTGRLIMDIPTCLAVTITLGVMPFVGIIVSVLWKKPWGVIGEFPIRYHTLHRTRDRAEADAIAQQLRAVIRH